MAQGKIIVDTSRLDSAASTVEGKADIYNTNYTKLYQLVQNLKTSFDGADYQAFSTQIEGFRDDFQRMEKLMRDYAAYLRKTAATYRETQSSIAAEAKRLSQGS